MPAFFVAASPLMVSTLSPKGDGVPREIANNRLETGLYSGIITFSFLYSMKPFLVTQLFIYPVKSLGGIEVFSAQVLPKGLAFDRRLMLVDENHRFLTQRYVPKMALCKMSFAEDGRKISVCFNGESFDLPMSGSGEAIKAEIWNDLVEVTEPDTALSKWFSDRLGISCKLVAFPEENPRPVDPDFALTSSDQTSLSDGYPILVIGQSSLEDLNKRLAEPVGIDRFRPNIVFTGGLPHEEDSWSRFAVGKVAMAGVKPCARCVMTTINQQTGEAGKEPLATLNSYRKVATKVLFGQNVIPLEKGIIHVGDEIILG